MSAEGKLATAATLLALAFPASSGAVRATHLTAAQRAVLAKLAAADALWESPEFAAMLVRFGLPTTRGGLSAWVASPPAEETLPPGPLFQEERG